MNRGEGVKRRPPFAITPGTSTRVSGQDSENTDDPKTKIDLPELGPTVTGAGTVTENGRR